MQIKHLVASDQRIDWRTPAALLILSAVPALAGFMRLTGLIAGGPITPDNARFFNAPLPIAIHILSAVVFCVLGAFQFSVRLRRLNPGWHRVAGHVLVLCGLLAGLSGLWMTVRYPIDMLMQGTLLFYSRILFGSLMVLSITSSLIAILRRDIARHRAWMIRAYALGLGAGTQVLVVLPWMLITRETGGLTRDLLMSAAWVINLAVAEWLISRKTARECAHPTGSLAVSGDD